ncbi:MAG: SH3 domain-containing protein [Treponema sp.]|nr:SH3 domain-containing protein [Treponema sp.]
MKMKKMILLLAAALCSSSAFSLDAGYFKKHKKVHFLYVDSPEGLRVRSSSSLSAEKTGVLYDRMKIKVISVGSEATIDGIKSNWVKILLPVDTLKSNSATYGWIFGGYLTNKLKPFSTEGWTDADLRRYLCRFSWALGERGYIIFNPDGTCSLGLLESGSGGGGTYKVSMNDMTITITATVGDEDSEGEEMTETYSIISIEEEKITLDSSVEFMLEPSIINNYFYSFLMRENPKIGWFEELSFYALMYPFSSDILQRIDEGYDDFIKNSTGTLIMMGIYVDDAGYKAQFKSYWK